MTEHWLAERLEAQMRRTPAAAALKFLDEQLSYSQLEERSRAIASRLVEAGVGPGSIVGVLLDPSIDLVCSIVAVVRAGAAYLPIDVDYPDDRVGYMLTDAAVDVVVSGRKYLPRLPRELRRVVHPADCVGNTRSLNRGEVKSDDPAYIIYTSGSTGRPKGVLVTQRNVVRLFDVTDPVFRFDETDVWALFHSVAFDFSVWEMWGALLYGGLLNVVPRVTARSPSEYLEWLARERITILNQTPSAFARLSHSRERSGVVLPQLRWLVLGGERLAPSSLRPWMEAHRGEAARVANMYGITETTVHVTFREILPEDLHSSKSVIGLPLPDLSIRLMRDDGTEAAPGEIGEICVYGPGVSRGYLNRPELTDEKFPHVAGDEGGTRFYRSGDLARLIDTGEYEYIGRADSQVKLRGFRIELGEIESCLGSVPGIVDVVAAIADGASDGDIVAFFQQYATSENDLAERLKSVARSTLPSYMVPSRFVRVLEFPLTLHGKVDRVALLRDADVPALAPEAPSDDQHLLHIWRQVLKMPRLSEDDNFFEYGAHSALILRGIHQMQKELSLDVSFRDVFENPTVQGLRLGAREVSQAVEGSASRPGTRDESP